MIIEPHDFGNRYRREYLNGLEKLIEKEKLASRDIREAFSADILSRPEEYRAKYKEMLGWPLTLPKDDTLPEVKQTFVGKDGEISVYRMQIDVLGVPFYGILFVKEDGKKRPLVISQHGGLGTPELCSSMFTEGSSNYNDMTVRVLEYDVNVFAPQLLLWRGEFDILPEDEEKKAEDTSPDPVRRGLDNELKQLGGSITAFEIYCIQRALDYLQAQPYVDAEHMGMTGLSYGGFYTLYTVAAEPRLKSSLSCCSYSDRLKYNWLDWTWKDAAHTFTDNEVALLIYPRALILSVGTRDELFEVEKAREEYAALEKFLPADHRFLLETFDGTHEYTPNESMVEQFIRELKK